MRSSTLCDMPGSIQSVRRAAAILRLFASGSTTRLGVAELSHALDLPKGTVHGLLRTLQQVGFVEQDTASGKYRLAATLGQLGAGFPDPNELRTAALSGADVLALRSRESVRVGKLHGERVLVVHHVFRPDHSMQVLEVGARLPLHASALGKVLAAYDPLAAQACDRGRLGRFTKRTITAKRTLQAELRALRRRGWGSEVEELTAGEASLAAPIRGSLGLPVGAIGISGAVARLCSDGRPRMDLVSHVREAARAVSRRLAAGL
jgi:DNA-binding IclR family transcriptional regulator